MEPSEGTSAVSGEEGRVCEKLPQCQGSDAAGAGQRRPMTEPTRTPVTSPSPCGVQSSPQMHASPVPTPHHLTSSSKPLARCCGCRWSPQALASVWGCTPFRPEASISSLSIENSSLFLCHCVSQAPVCVNISSALLGGSVRLLIDPWTCGAD